MPWSEVSVMDLRLEFVMLAEQPGSNVSALCRRFGISRKTGYKWLGRAGSGAALSDRSRRPRSNPRRTPEGMEAAVLADPAAPWRLQLRAAPSGPRLGRAGCPIPTQSASLPRGPAAHRVRARTSGPPRPGQRPHQLQRQDLQTAQGVRRIPGRTGANHPRRNMEGDLRKPPDRATRHARWHSQNCYPCLRTPVTLVPGPYTCLEGRSLQISQPMAGPISTHAKREAGCLLACFVPCPRHKPLSRRCAMKRPSLAGSRAADGWPGERPRRAHLSHPYFAKHGLIGSMSRRGNPYENAMAESFCRPSRSKQSISWNTRLSRTSRSLGDRGRYHFLPIRCPTLPPNHDPVGSSAEADVIDPHQ